MQIYQHIIFFQGEMKALTPVYGVLPYELINPLFHRLFKKKLVLCGCRRRKALITWVILKY